MALHPILMGIIAILVGGFMAGATIVGLVNAQTAPPDQSPGDSSNPVLEYGTTS